MVAKLVYQDIISQKGPVNFVKRILEVVANVLIKQIALNVLILGFKLTVLLDAVNVIPQNFQTWHLIVLGIVHVITVFILQAKDVNHVNN